MRSACSAASSSSSWGSSTTSSMAGAASSPRLRNASPSRAPRRCRRCPADRRLRRPTKGYSLMSHDPNLPNEFLDILSLAGIIIFLITSLSAVLSSTFVEKDNLLYLGTQLVLLSIFLLLSTHWSYPLWFSDVFSSAGLQLQFVETLLLLSIAYTIDMGLKVLVWEGTLRRHGEKSVPPLLIGSTRTLIYLFALL